MAMFAVALVRDDKHLVEDGNAEKWPDLKALLKQLLSGLYITIRETQKGRLEIIRKKYRNKTVNIEIKSSKKWKEMQVLILKSRGVDETF